MLKSLIGLVPESWACIDCGINTHPGSLSRERMEQAYALARATHSDEVATITFGKNTEVYMVKDAIWKAAGMDGCLCIGCLEKRLGRLLRPKDFSRNHSFNSMPGTERLRARRDGA